MPDKSAQEAQEFRRDTGPVPAASALPYFVMPAATAAASVVPPASNQSIVVDTGTPTVGQNANLDDRLPSTYSDDEWVALEGHMAAYFNADTDILATSAKDFLGNQRFIGIWRFAKSYRYQLDKKFPYEADKGLRKKIEAFFAKLEANAGRLFWTRVVHLAVLFAALTAATWRYYPNQPPPSQPDGVTQTQSFAPALVAPPQSAPADAAENLPLSPNDQYLAVLAVIALIYYFLWSTTIQRTKQRNHQLYTEFQTHYQLGVVTRLFTRYEGMHHLITTTRLRPPHTPPEETDKIVRKIERFVALMTWIAKRVEYYEKRFEVQYWLMLWWHMILNLLWIAVSAALFAGYATALGMFTDASSTIDVSVAKLPVFGSLIVAGAAFVILPFLLGWFERFSVGGSGEIQEGLKVHEWIRYSRFNLHNQLARVVGDQVRRIHQEEDRIR